MERKEYQGAAFDWLFFKRTFRLMKIAFPGWSSLTNALFAFLLTIALLEQYLIYNVGLISSQYYSVLGSRDYNGFWITTRNSLLFIVAISFVLSTKTYVCNLLYVAWRQVLCKALHRQYFFRIKYYQLNVMDDLIDNPDQRITQDVDKMCKTWSQIIAVIIVSPFTIAYYSYAAFSSTGWIGPVGIFVFFVVGTAINKLLMSPIVGLVVRQEKLEGDFRFKHMQIRSNSESLAFVNGGPVESTKANEKLNNLIQLQTRLFNRQYPLNISTNMFDYLGSIISYLVIAIPIFAGNYDDKTATELSSIISMTSFVCMYLINCFSQLVDQAAKVTDIAGTTHRVAQLIEELVRLPEKSIGPNGDSTVGGSVARRRMSRNLLDDGAETDRKGVFSLTKATYRAPNSTNSLLSGLNLVLRLGMNVVVTGNSSSGKSSLLRVLCGLWPLESGELESHISKYPSEMLVLPQKPYLTDGSLRQQILYPLIEDCDADSPLATKEDNVIVTYLRLVQLETLLVRVGGLSRSPEWNWYDVLSPGEMQRLSFSRLFYHNPKIAFLDEATSAVGLEMESVLYEECVRQGITIVSVGHRESVWKYHHVRLHLDGNGGWTISSLNPGPAAPLPPPSDEDRESYLADHGEI